MAAKRILIVDDEAALRRLLDTCLRRAGHQAFCCASAAEVNAMESGDWDAAIVDLSLPDCDGPALICELLERSPRLCVLASSGSPFDLSSIPAADRHRVAFLAKPYLPQDLLRALDSLLCGP
ncbi:MAG: response regulator [Bryobacteraceae bacterium]|nr:response regulator [Bryobacteraceae bacterium]MDW8376827.1 response regulator [Bryobacterales bacterium]